MCNVWTRKYEVVCPNVCCTRNYVMSEPDMSCHMLNAKIWCLVSKIMLHTKMHNVQTNLCYTLKYYVVSPKWCYIRQCYMFEPMLHMKIWYFVSALMLHTKICNVRTWDVFCPILCYIWKWNMSERILHTKYDVSELMLHTKICNIGTYVPQENTMSRVRTYAT